MFPSTFTKQPWLGLGAGTLSVVYMRTHPIRRRGDLRPRVGLQLCGGGSLRDLRKQTPQEVGRSGEGRPFFVFVFVVNLRRAIQEPF